MPMMSTRVLGGVCGALLVGAGCSDKFEMVTVALMTDPESTGVTTGGTTSETTTPTPTDSGDPSGDPGGDPTEATTAAPVTCDTPEACTDEGEGDVGPLTLPFFRGMVCVSDEIQPGDKLAVSISACVHPCLDVSGFKFKSLFRGADVGVEMALAFYYPEVTGTACPPDVFGEFPAEACVYTTPKTLGIGPVINNSEPYAGGGTFTGAVPDERRRRGVRGRGRRGGGGVDADRVAHAGERPDVPGVVRRGQRGGAGGVRRGRRRVHVPGDRAVIAGTCAATRRRWW
jgi:hypothetical protein